jgi:transposase
VLGRATWTKTLVLIFLSRWWKEDLRDSEMTIHWASMSDALAMPDNLQACQTLVEQLVITVAEQQQQITTLEDQRLAQQLEIAYLIKLAFHRRSERYLEDPNQLQLDLGDSDEAHDAAEGLQDAKQEQAAADELIIAEHTRKKQAKAKKPRNEQLPAHLPRYEVEAPATDEQQHCETHGERKVIGYDNVETLEYVRPQLKVRVTKYPKFACPNAPECGVTSPERAVGLVEGNRYDTSIAAEIITGKYGSGTAASVVAAGLSRARLVRQQRPTYGRCPDAFPQHVAEHHDAGRCAARAADEILRRLCSGRHGDWHGRHGRDAADAERYSARRSA